MQCKHCGGGPVYFQDKSWAGLDCWRCFECGDVSYAGPAEAAREPGRGPVLPDGADFICDDD